MLTQHMHLIKEEQYGTDGPPPVMVHVNWI